MNPVQRLFGIAWQEDNEIGFVELARTGIPANFKVNGEPQDTPQVRMYLRDLYNANPTAMALMSDRFHEVLMDIIG